jgi:hypothetical protein
MKHLDSVLTISFTLGGVLLVGIGAYLAYPPAAYVVVGFLLLGLVLVSKIRRRKPE